MNCKINSGINITCFVILFFTCLSIYKPLWHVEMHFRKRYLMRIWMPILLACIVLLLYSWSINPSYNSFDLSQLLRNLPVRMQGPIVNLTNNYYWRALQNTRGALLIDTPKCRLPDFDPFDPEVLSLLDPWNDHCEQNVKFTYVDQQKVVIDEAEVKARGYSLQNIRCCYRTIERVEQNLKTYDKYADRRIKYSDTCYPMMNLSTEPVSGFITVNCTGPGKKNGTKVIYQNFHALLKLTKAEQERIHPKLAFWKQYPKNRNKNSKIIGDLKPPSVLILGLDAISRLHFHRTMGKTRRLLEKIGAISMKGYNKIGDTTCKNLYNLLISHSYSMTEVNRICSSGGPEARAFDGYDFLWNHFSNQSYVTGFFEDAPWYSIFNMDKPGFVVAPTDLYLRHWMLAAYTKRRGSCLGYQRPGEVLLKYTEDSLALLNAEKPPYFMITWWTQFTHNGNKSANGGVGLDAPLAKMIETLHADGMLENTVLFVMGDHGYRYGKMVHTSSGWFEDNLPLMYIRLPESLKKLFPEWQEALEHNSQLLTSHWDTHETLKDILRLSDPNALNSISPRGRSFFKKIPYRNCSEANITVEHCVCLPDDWETLLDNSVIQYCVEKVIDKINKDLPSNCTGLYATSVKAVTVMNKTIDEGVITTPYSITFDAMPGNLTIEAMVFYDSFTREVRKIPYVTRKRTPGTNCPQDKDARLESFCV